MKIKDILISNNILYISPEDNVNGTYQITITAQENYDLDNDDKLGRIYGHLCVTDGSEDNQQ